MAKKRKKEQEPKPSLVEAIGLSDLFRNSEKLLFFVGLLIFALSIFILLSFVSFFTTGQADQSMIENLRDGELANEGRKFINYCGSLGAYTAFFFIKQWFGLPAFFIPAFLLLVSLNLMKAGVISGYDITTEALLTKMMILLGEFPDDPEKVKEYLGKDLCGEMTID